jgi:hypothetical protein
VAVEYLVIDTALNGSIQSWVVQQFDGERFTLNVRRMRPGGCDQVLRARIGHPHAITHVETTLFAQALNAVDDFTRMPALNQ